MSDENDDDQQPQGFFVQMPPEVRAAMQAQQEHAQMHHDEATHSLYGMLEELSIDHLRNLKLILHNLGDAPQALGFWEGLIAAKIAERTKTCLACGNDHDAMLKAMLENEQQEPVANDSAAAVEASRVAERDALMNEYHVAPILDDQPDGKVYCTGITPGAGPCGVTHPNLKDRMLRPADHCSGCFARAGQG